ncbi:hypothetical protein M9Y10_006016 [Tritrichomonas musculus]|uniref:Uncharacterized protein n=1 Tax=Tritrichomonas musculus TaxID=1915356 RepID=A0ABR2JDJ4_9EUKA
MNLFEPSKRNETKIKKVDFQRAQQSVKRSTPENKTQDRIDRKIISEKRKKEKPGDYKRDTDYSDSE